MAAPQASSRLEMLQARFQQKQLQEKEQKLLQLYDQQQQRAYQVVQRGSAGSNSSHHGSTAVRTATTTTTATTATSTSQGGKVRQMFDERRQTTVKGIDRSYPLEPLENKLRKQTNMNGVAATQRNGNVTVNRQSVKRVTRADVNSNVNGGKPVVSYHEEIIRDSFGPSIRRHDDEDEYGVENCVATFANGHYRHENDNEQDEMLDQDLIDRNRMMAKIHLMGFDESLKHRVKNDLESEEFPEYLMVDVPDKFSKKNATRKLSQAEERLERFKNANAKRSNVTKQSTSTSTVAKKRAEPAIPKSNSRLRNRIAGTSPTSARSGSSWISERSQRIFDSAESPAGTRVVDEMSARWKENSDTETIGQRASPRGLLSKEATKVVTTSRFYPRINGFKSLTSDGKIFVRRGAVPQFFCRESERSATTVSLNHQKSDSSGSPLFRRNTLIKRNSSPRLSLSESERSRRTSESKSPIWSETRVSSRQSTSPQYLRYESKRSETATSTDRETIESKSSEKSRGSLTKRNMINSERQKIRTSTLGGRRSFQYNKPPFYEEDMFKKRSTSPQFFCKETERSATTMSIDRKSDSSGSPLFRRDTLIKRKKSPQFFLSESEQSHRRSESKSPIWSDRELSSVRSTSPQYRESKRSEITSIGRGTVESKSGDLNERNSARLARLFVPARSAITTSIDRKYNRFKSSEITRDRRAASPQFFCKESEKSATTMLIEPKSTDTTESTMKQRGYTSDTSYKQPVSSPINKKVSYISTKYRRTPSPSITKYEVKTISPKGRIITETRRSPKISEISATSASSIVNLKYGLELDNIFQSTELVRKFIKSQDGKQRAIRQSPSKRNANGNQWKNQRKPSPLFRTTSPWSVESRKRTTPEFSRKTITPTEADVDIQEITMTDHRIERDKLQKASSPISMRQFDGRYTKSPSSGTKFKTSTVYPARKLHEHQGKSILESDVFKKSLSDRESTNPRSDQESEKSVVSLIRRSTTKPQTIALNKELKACRKISSPTSVDRTASKRIFFCGTIHTPVKSSASRKTISPTRECGRRHDIKSKVSSSRVSPLRKTAEISRDTPTVFSSWSIASKADQSKRRSTEGRSPTCKRRLFESDSDKEDLLKLTRVRVGKGENCPSINFRPHKNETASSLKSSKDFNHDVTRDSTRSEDTSAFSVKPLRSIEDIRKSIDKNSKLNIAEKSRSAIANRRSALRESVNARRSSTAANAASNVFLGTNPVKLVNIKPCVSRITKSPSPDSAAIKQRETNARTTRGSIPSSPSKSPEIASRRPATDSRNQEAKLSRRSTFAKGTNSSGNKMTESDTTDGVILQNGSANESTRKSDSFMVDFDDRPSKEDDAMLPKRSLMKKSSNEKQQTTSSVSGRPTSSSNSSANFFQDSTVKSRMAENDRGKGIAKGGGKVKNKGTEKPSSSSGKFSNASNFNEDTTTDMKGLARCKTCGRSFAQNRIGLHEEICMKTTTKKRKQFDPVMSRVKGTELEPFVKKGFAKREAKKKPEVKSDWRRKHEEFISAIRYARETQARLAAGGNLSDLPPPPPSDTSDYIQCEHCGRKFNRSAAERHIPICKRMHDKKQTQAPRARR